MAVGDDDGKSYDGMWWINGAWLPSGSWGYSPEPVTKCECGVDKIYGAGYAEEKHSEYCPVYKKWKENAKKNGTSVS